MMDREDTTANGDVDESVDDTAAVDTTAAATTAVDAGQVPISPASIVQSPTDPEVQHIFQSKFDFQLHAMHIDASLNSMTDKLLNEIHVLKQTPPPNSIIPPPAVPPNYQQLYIESLLQRIDSLERTVANQHAQMMLLIESTAPPECAPAPPASRTTAPPPSKTSLQVAPASVPVAKAPPAKVRAAPAPAPPLAPPSQTTAPKSKPNPKVARVEVIGDSMLGGIRNWYKNDEYSAKVHSYGGATTRDMNDMLEIALRRDPDALIVHSGTNDFDHKINTKKELQRIVAKARGKKADLKIAISSICFRQDKPHLMPKIKDMNNQLKNFCHQHQLTYIDHSDFDHSCLSEGGLHPEKRGNTSLYMDFKRTIDSLLNMD